MSVIVGRLKDKDGNLGCCRDRHGDVYCEWYLHGHPFCTSGCEWIAAKGEEE